MRVVALANDSERAGAVLAGLQSGTPRVTRLRTATFRKVTGTSDPPAMTFVTRVTVAFTGTLQLLARQRLGARIRTKRWGDRADPAMKCGKKWRQQTPAPRRLYAMADEETDCHRRR
jgi:hypothetical protein